MSRLLIAGSRPFSILRQGFLIACLVICSSAVVIAKDAPRSINSAQALADSVRDHMDVLAGDSMRGRGSATVDEARAADYIASELKRYGIAPAGDNSGFIQNVKLPPILTHSEPRSTVNVIGILRGSDPARADEVILLSAHLDHLGVGKPVNGDAIYNGADDDASGVCAVLELARILGSGTRPKRTVVFVLFGSEELGSLGGAWFREHPPVPLKNIVANLEFEMIGRPDPAVPDGDLWLTGFERSSLGPELARHGAHLVADPHPEQKFFMRSDNYGLAKQGIIAHTVSSFGLHADYHRPSDDIAHLDFKHMDIAIASMIAPVRWLVDSDFKPQWADGKQPR